MLYQKAAIIAALTAQIANLKRQFERLADSGAQRTRGQREVEQSQLHLQADASVPRVKLEDTEDM